MIGASDQGAVERAVIHKVYPLLLARIANARLLSWLQKLQNDASLARVNLGEGLSLVFLTVDRVEHCDVGTSRVGHQVGVNLWVHSPDLQVHNKRSKDKAYVAAVKVSVLDAFFAEDVLLTLRS